LWFYLAVNILHSIRIYQLIEKGIKIVASKKIRKIAAKNALRILKKKKPRR
jgi:hypothetical protein